ncbi:GNAT family N-acetyltransferase [Sulfurimonas paralvinellae]|uniref:GNAT family N-acetyltransferase n=1 Tax=Sulfurimonas paralvinellae TaxID=317658 RepID=A0A7M1B659_9BACT|nr:GNAT family N-acetyltransferase [Sulfurimonas paralvinellae]QOP45213.1 GNAT family N-acetyltransferase [Sulfurimonas paralvinellae]
MQIRKLDLKELDVAWSLVKQLRVQLEYEEFENLIYEMRDREYTMLGVFEKERLMCYAGVVIQTNLYHKRHLFIDELVSDENYRSQGYGKMMLEYLQDYAKIAACENIVLSSGLQREDAHRFYEKEGFMKKSFVFVKPMKNS